MPSVTESHTVPKSNTNNRDSKVSRNRARSWCFTLNNYKEEDIVTLAHPKWENMRIKRICFQEEIGEDSKIPHLQGVVQFEESTSFSTLKDFHDKIHWEKCKSLPASIKYCSKVATRNGKLYTHNIADKSLWKEGVRRPKGLDRFGHREMLISMCEQMKATVDRKWRQPWETWTYVKPEWLVEFEGDLSQSTPPEPPLPGGEEVAPLQPPVETEGALGC